MKKLLTLIVAVAMMVNTTNAAFTESKADKKEAYSTFSSAEKKAAAEFFVKLSRKDYEKLSGRHLTLAERLTFKVTQSKLKHDLKRASESEGFNIGGFALGFLLGLLGVLGAYVFSQDDNLRKWAWIGLGAAVVFYLILVVAIIGSAN